MDVQDEERAWVVLYTDGLACAPCRTAKTNLMRLSASLRALPVGVGYVDCEAPGNRQLCAATGLPAPPHAPEWRGFGRGAKWRGDGEILFDSSRVDVAQALEMIYRGLRLALADRELTQAFDGAQEKGAEPSEAAPFGGVRWDGAGERQRGAKPLPWGGPRRPENAGQRITA